MALKNRTYLIIIIAIFSAYIHGRVISALPALSNPRELADTAIYLRLSRQSVLLAEFWNNSRPPVFPLLLKIARQDFHNVAIFQLGFSIFSWSCFALTTTFLIKFDWLKVFAFSLILLFSLDRHITSWDFVMMTESISLSLLVLMLASCIWLLQGWHPLKALALLITVILFAFTRDSNAWLLLMVSGLVLVAIILHWLEIRSIIAIPFLVVIFITSNSAANIGNRWVFPLGNLIGQRILTDDAAIEFFNQSCGMPLSPALYGLSGKFANANNRALYNDPQLKNFRNWLFSEGKSCYMKWLISNPVQSTLETKREFEELITFPRVDRYFTEGFNPLMPIKLGKLFYPERFASVIWWYTTIATLIALWKKFWHTNPLWGIYICMNLLVFPHLFITWHGDAMAPDRHALSVGVQLYLSFWILNILLIEQLLKKKLMHR